MTPLETHVNGVWSRFYKALYTQTVAAWPKILTGVFIFLLFVLLAIIVRVLIVHLTRRVKRRQAIYQLLAKVAKVGIIVFGLITALGTMGIDVTALVTGLGLTGFAVGLALKDPISNAISGFMVLLYEPFVVGDTIVFSGTEGKVGDIRVRYTVLVTDEQHMLIPNANLLTNTITVKNRSYQKPQDSLASSGGE